MVTKWLIIVDADEFVVPLKGTSLLTALIPYENYGGVYVNWLRFGTSKVEKIPENTLMIEMVNHCEERPQELGKSIVRPERVSQCTDPHRMWYFSPFYHVNTRFETFDWICPVADDKLLIYHYYAGDLYNVYHVKFPRRKKWVGIDLETYLSTLDALNVRKNTYMQRFVPQLRSRMGKLNKTKQFNS